MARYPKPDTMFGFVYYLWRRTAGTIGLCELIKSCWDPRTMRIPEESGATQERLM